MASSLSDDGVVREHADPQLAGDQARQHLGHPGPHHPRQVLQGAPVNPFLDRSFHVASPAHPPALPPWCTAAWPAARRAAPGPGAPREHAGTPTASATAAGRSRARGEPTPPRPARRPSGAGAAVDGTGFRPRRRARPGSRRAPRQAAASRGASRARRTAWSRWPPAQAPAPTGSSATRQPSNSRRHARPDTAAPAYTASIGMRGSRYRGWPNTTL